MKKGIRILTGILVLGALSGAYVLLKTQNEKQKEEEEIAALGDVILEVESADLAGLSFQIEGETMAFVFQDDTWQLESDETFPVDENALLSTLNQLEKLYASRTLTDIADSAEYGMEEPQNVIILTDTEGTQTVLTIGAANEGTGDDYLMLDQDETRIYTIDAAVRTSFSDDLYDYAVSEELPYLFASDIAGVKVSRETDSYDLYLENGIWKVKSDDKESADADSDLVNDALNSLAGLSYVDYLEHNCSDLSLYGLEEPDAVLTVSYKEEAETEETADTERESEAGTESDSETETETESETEENYVIRELVLLIGTTDANGDFYVQQEGSTQVHTIDADILSEFLAGNQQKWEAQMEENTEEA